MNKLAAIYTALHSWLQQDNSKGMKHTYVRIATIYGYN